MRGERRRANFGCLLLSWLFVPFFIILIILQMRAIEVENRQIYQSVITVKSFLTTLKNRQNVVEAFSSRVSIG